MSSRVYHRLVVVASLPVGVVDSRLRVVVFVSSRVDDESYRSEQHTPHEVQENDGERMDRLETTHLVMRLGVMDTRLVMLVSVVDRSWRVGVEMLG